MNFYKRHLGDYAKDTMRLTLLEHGVYTLLLDYYYATEKPLPVSRKEIFKICKASHRCHSKAVARVLGLYFVRTKQGYLNKRADEEIENAKTRINTARNNGQHGGRPPHKQNPLGFPEKPAGFSPETHSGSYPDSRLQKPETGTPECSNPSSQAHLIKHKKRESSARTNSPPSAAPALSSPSPEMIHFAKRKGLDPQLEFQKFIAWNKARHKVPDPRMWDLWCLRAPIFNGSQEEPLDDDKIRAVRESLRLGRPH